MHIFTTSLPRRDLRSEGRGSLPLQSMPQQASLPLATLLSMWHSRKHDKTLVAQQAHLHTLQDESRKQNKPSKGNCHKL